ncbi:MAG: hypothetical protein ABUT39_24355 [Acidobacteriota bacterium]
MKVRLSLTLALLLLCAGAALAKTPDGVPPSLETVCDMEQGAAYGLCTAYCEAMDCESAAPHASATACAKVGGKFLQLTGRNLPCEVSCPCASVEGNFARVLAGQIPIELCSKSEAGVGVVEDEDQPDDLTAFSLVFEGQRVCGYVGDGEVLPISPEQGQYCAQLLEQKANSEGVTCTGPE